MTTPLTDLCRRLVLASGLLLLLALPTAQAQNLVYDTFTAPKINANKWTAEQSGAGGLDLVRQITGGRLVLGHRVVGEVTAETGENNSANSLRFLRNRDWSGIRFVVRVTELALRGCATAGTAPAQARVGVFGRFFHDGRRDVNALLFAERFSDTTDAPGLLRVVGVVTRCTDAACTAVEEVGAVDLGTLAVGVETTLLLRWASATNRFLFRKGDAAARAIRYEAAVPSERTTRNLSVGGRAPHCPDMPRPFATITATIDNVMIADKD
jgi:hypothetical protein